MAIHVQDAEADRLIRDFAKRRGLGITEALKTAVREATRAEQTSVEDALRKLEPTLARIRSLNTQGFDEAEEKSFMDQMWGDPK